MSSKGLIGLSCVNVGTGLGGTITMLARVSVVDHQGQMILDTYVQPTSSITSYRTASTGLGPEHFGNAQPFLAVQAHVASLIRGKVVVGYCLWNDFQVLGISHPAVDTRDVALFLPFRRALNSPNDILGLATLIWHLMRRKIGERYMDSLENCRACIDLFRSHSKEWEECLSAGHWPCALPPSEFARYYS